MRRSVGGLGGKNRKEKKKIEKGQKGGMRERRPQSNDKPSRKYNDVLVPYYCIT
jgi:hypothetical protein